MEKVVQLPEANLLLPLRERHQPFDVLLQNLRDRHHLRTARVQDDGPGRNRLLARRKGVERGLDLLLRRAGLQLQLDTHGVGGEVVQLAHHHLLLLDGIFDRGGDGVGRLAPRQLGNDELVLVLGLDDRANLHFAETVLVVGRVHDAAQLEIREKRDGLFLDEVDLGFKQLDEVVRQDGGGEAHGNAVRAQHQQERYLGRQIDGLLLASVVVGHELGGLLVEHLLARKVGELALDVTRGGVRHAGVDGAEVSLAVDEIAVALAPELVRQDHDRVANRGVAMRVVLHGVADDVGDLGVLAVVLLPQRMHDAALHGLEAVFDGGDGTVADDIGGILAEVEVEEFAHRAMPGQCRSGSGRLGGLGISRVIKALKAINAFRAINAVNAFKVIINLNAIKALKAVSAIIALILPITFFASGRLFALDRREKIQVVEEARRFVLLVVFLFLAHGRVLYSNNPVCARDYLLEMQGLPGYGATGSTGRDQHVRLL